MDPNQTAHIGAVWSGSTLCVHDASNISAEDNNIRCFVIRALRVNACEFSVYMVRIFMKCTHLCMAQTTY